MGRLPRGGGRGGEVGTRRREVPRRREGTREQWVASLIDKRAPRAAAGSGAAGWPRGRLVNRLFGWMGNMVDGLPQTRVRSPSGELQAYVVRHFPDILHLEDAATIHSNAEAHRAATDAMLQMPYVWWTGVADAAATFGAQHRRKRRGWTAVRVDRLRRKVERRQVGAWWMTGGECSGCGAYKARGKCILADCDGREEGE